MADSRPMSRRGRSRKFPDYEESGLAYSEDILPYSNIDYIKQEEVYHKRDTPVLPERPKTSHGRRQRDPLSQPSPSGEQNPAQPESSSVQVMRFDAPQSEDDLNTEHWVSGDTYNPEQWTDGDTYRSDQWTDTDHYPPEQRTETDPYTQDEWTDPYSQEQPMQDKTYAQERVDRETWDNDNQEMWRTHGEQSYGDGLSSSKQYGDFSPMPQPPEAHRPSSKRRQRNRNGKRHSEDIIMQEVNMRPTSSLTKYRPLPSIGRKPTKSSHQVENIVSSTSVLSVSDPPRERKHRNRNKAPEMSNKPAKMPSAMTDDWPVESDSSMPQESHHHKRAYSESQSLVLDQPGHQLLSGHGQPDQPYSEDVTQIPAPESQRYRSTGQSHTPEEQTSFTLEQFEQNELQGQQAIESFHQAGALAHQSLPQFQQYEVQAHQAIQEIHQTKQEAIPQFSQAPEKNETEFHQAKLLAHQSVPQFHQGRQEYIPHYSQAPEKDEAEFHQPELLAHQAFPQFHQGRQEAISQYSPAPEKYEAEFHQPELLAHQSVLQFHQGRQEAMSQAPEKDKTDHRRLPEQSHPDNTQVQEPTAMQQETSHQDNTQVQEPTAVQQETSHQDNTQVQEPTAVQQETSHQDNTQVQEPTAVQQETLHQDNTQVQEPTAVQQETSHQDNTHVQEPMAVQQETSAGVEERVPTEEETIKETREEKDHKSSALMRKINNTKSEQEQLIQGMSRSMPTERHVTDQRAHQSELAPNRREARRLKAPPSLQSAAKQKKNLKKYKTKAAARNSPSKNGVEFTPHSLSTEPSDKEERILLAVKLPSGQRCQRFFRPSETIELILKFAENSCSTDLSGYLLVSNMPRVACESRTQTIRDASLKDRTVLFLEEREAIE